MPSPGERFEALTAPRPFSRREFWLAALGFAVLGGLAFLPHILHGGFYGDDWADASKTLFPGRGIDFGHSLGLAWGTTSFRPGLVLYVPLKYLVLGADPAAQLTLSVVLAIAVAALLYAVMRKLGVPRAHAWMIAALTLVFPSYDSTRFWEAASLPTIALVFTFGGLWLALVALDRRSWRLHLLAAALYLVSILIYEIALPLTAAFGLIYVARAGWRRARRPWAIDIVVIVAAGLWNLLNTVRADAGLGAMPGRAGEIVRASGPILASAVYPLGEDPRTTAVLLVLAVVFAAGLLAYLEGPRSREGGGWGLREWLVLAGVGLAVAFLGWVVFLPADPYYTPSLFGNANRINAVAGIGLIIVVYAAIGTVVTLSSLYLRPLRRWAPALIVLVAVGLGASYLHTLERHGDVWDSANSYQRAALAKIKAAYPTLPPGTTVITTGYPANVGLGVQIFDSSYDLSSALQLEYGDYSLEAQPLVEGDELHCEANGLHMENLIPSPAPAPWGTARMLDLADGSTATPGSRAECEALLQQFTPGPLTLQPGY